MARTKTEHAETHHIQENATKGDPSPRTMRTEAPFGASRAME